MYYILKHLQFLIFVFCLGCIVLSCQKEPQIINVTSVSLNETSLTLTEGDFFDLVATVHPQDATNKEVIWSTSDCTIATVNNNGKVAAIAQGSVIISVITDDGKKISTCSIFVNSKIIPVESIYLDKSSVEMMKGETMTLIATIEPNNATDKTILWLSSNENVASVNNGEIIALDAGEAIITAKAEDRTATCKVTVQVPPSTPEEPLLGEFSVSDNKKVRFSKGNLRYIVGSKKWCFFDEQYECGPNYFYDDGQALEISLFSWGYNATQSIIPNKSYSDNVSIKSGDLSQSEDWGSQIDDGKTWRTLTSSEWEYLIRERTESANKVGFASVGGIHGIIIIPDIFSDPNTNRGSMAFIPRYSHDWGANIYEAGNDWDAMESAGAVFLPAAGYRDGVMISSIGDTGNYWCSTGYEDGHAMYGHFSWKNIGCMGSGRGGGHSVRLVTDVK